MPCFQMLNVNNYNPMPTRYNRYQHHCHLRVAVVHLLQLCFALLLHFLHPLLHLLLLVLLIEGLLFHKKVDSGQSTLDNSGGCLAAQSQLQLAPSWHIQRQQWQQARKL